MKKTIIYYYSSTGNNAFLAKKLAKETGYVIEQILPSQKGGLFMMFKSWVKWGTNPKTLKHHPKHYDHVILIGPIWMGTLISPLRGFINAYKSQIQHLTFITACGSTPENKNSKFGYETVFNKLKEVGQEIPFIQTFSLPVAFTLPKDQRESDELVINKRLTDADFTGEYLLEYEKIKAQLFSATVHA